MAVAVAAELGAALVSPLSSGRGGGTEYSRLVSLRPPQCRRRQTRMCCAQSAFRPAVRHQGTITRGCADNRRKEKSVAVTDEMIDQWMRDSIAEIVRNVGKAPFFVQIFSPTNEESTNSPYPPAAASSASCSSSSSSLRRGIRFEREAASTESWLSIKSRWERDDCMPDGVVLVEELHSKVDDNDDIGNCCQEASGATSEAVGGEERRSWGLVVQGRGLDCPPACYVLNTCKVRSSIGFCTHFCLVRAQCFGESIETQLKNTWLLQNRP